MERCIISNLQRQRKDGLIKKDRMALVGFHPVKSWLNNNFTSSHRYQALLKSVQRCTYLPRTRVAKTNAIDFMQSRQQDPSIISAKDLEPRHNNNTFHTAPNLDEKRNKRLMSFQLNTSCFLTDNLRQHSNNSCNFSIKDFSSNYCTRRT